MNLSIELGSFWCWASVQCRLALRNADSSVILLQVTVLRPLNLFVCVFNHALITPKRWEEPKQ